jgi:hypothetical protein
VQVTVALLVLPWDWKRLPSWMMETEPTTCD